MSKKLTRVSLPAVLLLLCFSGFEVRGQDYEELKKEIETLKQGQQQIQRQLIQILRLIQQQGQPARPQPQGPDVEGKTFELGSNPVIGENTAPLTLVEFTDYQ